MVGNPYKSHLVEKRSFFLLTERDGKENFDEENGKANFAKNKKRGPNILKRKFPVPRF